MIRKLILAFACAALASCGPLTEARPNPVSDTLNKTLIDDKAITLAFELLDSTAQFVKRTAGKPGGLTPGTPKAITVADGLETTLHWLQIASRAQRAGSAATYGEAIANATAAFAKVRAALNSS